MSFTEIKRPLHILMVEDSESDSLLLREAILETQIPHHLTIMRDGQAASDFLNQDFHPATHPRPDLVFLDLNLPKKHGLDVLTEIKMSPVLQVIPVIIFTTSQSHEDIQRAYRGYANSYAVKPLELDEFMGLIRNILNYWVNVVILP